LFVNDKAIAVQLLLNNNSVNKFLIIDLGVRQGNGTAKIFRKNNRVFTFIMHGEKNYPFKKNIRFRSS